MLLLVFSAPALRLEDNEVSWSGRLEVQYNGQWGTVCDDDFDNTDASVACKQLGLGYVGYPCSIGSIDRKVGGGVRARVPKNIQYLILS